MNVVCEVCDGNPNLKFTHKPHLCSKCIGEGYFVEEFYKEVLHGNLIKPYRINEDLLYTGDGKLFTSNNVKTLYGIRKEDIIT